MCIIQIVTKSSTVTSVAENSASSGFKFKSPSSSSFLLNSKKTTSSTPTPGHSTSRDRGSVEEEVEGGEGVGITELNSRSVYKPELVFLVVDEVNVCII